MKISQINARLKNNEYFLNYQNLANCFTVYNHFLKRNIVKRIRVFFYKSLDVLLTIRNLNQNFVDVIPERNGVQYSMQV